MDRLIFEYQNILRTDPTSLQSEFETLFAMMDADEDMIETVYEIINSVNDNL